jgi:hypothetical protein
VPYYRFKFLFNRRQCPPIVQLQKEEFEHGYSVFPSNFRQSSTACTTQYCELYTPFLALESPLYLLDLDPIFRASDAPCFRRTVLPTHRASDAPCFRVSADTPSIMNRSQRNVVRFDHCIRYTSFNNRHITRRDLYVTSSDLM